MKSDALHDAAERIANEAGTQYMDDLANKVGAEGLRFLAESDLSDENGVPFVVDSPSFCYGVTLGYLAALEDCAE